MKAHTHYLSVGLYNIRTNQYVLMW